MNVVNCNEKTIFFKGIIIPSTCNNITGCSY